MFDTKALAGQIGDHMITRLKSMTQPFDALPQATQQALIDGCYADGKAVVNGALTAILEKGDAELDVTMHDVKIKKESVQAVVSCPRDHQYADQMFRNAHAPAKVHFLNVDQTEIFSLGTEQKAVDDQQTMLADEPAKSAPVAESTKAKAKPRGRPKGSKGSRRNAPKARHLKVVEQTEEMDLATE